MTIPFRLPFTEEQIDEMVALYKRGHGVTAIAEKFDCLSGSISSRLKKRGVRMRPPHRRKAFTWHRTEHGYFVYHKTYLHRIVAEAWRGRPLRDGEHVHHKNGNKADNRPANLEVVTPQEHRAKHAAWTPEDDWVLIRLREAGHRATEIAEAFGLKVWSINNRVSRLIRDGKTRKLTGRHGGSPITRCRDAWWALQEMQDVGAGKGFRLPDVAMEYVERAREVQE